jgi:hypothetical protein
LLLRRARADEIADDDKPSGVPMRAGGSHLRRALAPASASPVRTARSASCCSCACG